MTTTVHDDLERTASLVPVELDGADERSWLDCDLASLAENRVGDFTDPRTFDEERRAALQARVTLDRPWSLSARSAIERSYWIVDDGERAGTIAVALTPLGGEHLYVGSFYVFRSFRGRGVGARALARVEATLARRRLGVCLDTGWTWQRAVRFYFRAGMWVFQWRHDLSFCSDPVTPRPIIDVGERIATLSAGDVVLARAIRHGDGLELDDVAPLPNESRWLGRARANATSTLAVAVALRGWPLVRSKDAWEHNYDADAGAPEALAHKITQWEAWDREHGWIVDTPRIPGLTYPTWRELDALDQNSADATPSV